MIRKLGAGEITPEQAATVMSVVSAQARMIEVDELEKRLRRLNSNESTHSDHPPWH